MLRTAVSYGPPCSGNHNSHKPPSPVRLVHPNGLGTAQAGALALVPDLKASRHANIAYICKQNTRCPGREVRPLPDGPYHRSAGVLSFDRAKEFPPQSASVWLPCVITCGRIAATRLKRGHKSLDCFNVRMLSAFFPEHAAMPCPFRAAAASPRNRHGG